MSEEMLRVVVCRVGREPAVEEIRRGLESFRALVGGTIDYVGLGDGYAIVCNDEGALIPLPPNRCGIRGDFFVTRVPPGRDTEESLDLPDIERVLAYCAAYRDVPCTPVGGSMRFIEADSLEDLERKREQLRRDHLERN